MPLMLSGGKIKLPRSVVTEYINKAKDSSTIAALTPNVPQSFADVDHMIFVPSAEAEVVEEGAPKSSYDQDLGAVTGKRVKVVTNTRVSDELKWADEDNRLEIISNIVKDQSEAIGRALDYVIYHAINPRKGTALAGYDALAAKAQQVTASDDELDNIDALTDKLLDYAVNGIAVSRAYAAVLRKLRVPASGMRLFPEIPLSLELGSLDGIPAACSGTVNGRLAQTPTNVEAIMGDFGLIKWGYVRDAFSEVIEYGDPDNTGADLKGNNQVCYRTEAVLGYSVLDYSGFAVLKKVA
ncbi:MAG: phage major capsid protein [Atopobiaceae bacterium]|nr:phage major capsid protein [Atopobiaceae bacterium]